MNIFKFIGGTQKDLSQEATVEMDFSTVCDPIDARDCTSSSVSVSISNAFLEDRRRHWSCWLHLP